MQNSGFPDVQPIGELAPGDAPIELAWCSHGVWKRCELPTVGDEVLRHPDVDVEHHRSPGWPHRTNAARRDNPRRRCAQSL